MANGIAERLIGTLRRDCLNHMVILGEVHLRRILTAYAIYYNQSRTHLALNKDCPLERPIQRLGSVAATPVLAGLHQTTNTPGSNFRKGQRIDEPSLKRKITAAQGGDQFGRMSIANPHPVPPVSRWHPLPATVVAHADSASEECEVVSVPEVSKVMKVMKAMKAMKVSDVVSWKDRAVVEPMHASPSAGHAKVVWAAEGMDAARAVHATKAVASHTAHRVGGHH
jgi:Integrase core domain